MRSLFGRIGDNYTRVVYRGQKGFAHKRSNLFNMALMKMSVLWVVISYATVFGRT